MAAELCIERLRVEFTRAPGPALIEGVDLTVPAGRTLALVGESGSGKSLTAASVMRLLPAGIGIAAGSIRLGDLNLLAASPRDMNQIRGRRIAMLFQQPKAMLDPTATVASQVAEPLRLHLGMSRRQAHDRVIELLAEVGIAEPERRAHAYAHQLSGGMAQRVMIAAALAGEPDLLIADEPTTALDVTIQAQILRLLAAKRRARQMSILLITHDLGIVSSMADRVAVMYAGRIVEDAAVAEIFEHPRHPYTQALLKCSLLEPGEGGRLFAIRGVAATARHISCGCRFRPRCAIADASGMASQCETAEPVLDSCGPDHHSRCWMTSPIKEVA
jgi:peptide/nickel transport system ATP-binding protein